jgi:hypothetical protein
VGEFLAIEHGFGSFPAELRRDYQFGDTSEIKGCGTDLTHLDRSRTLHSCSTRKPTGRVNLAVLLTFRAYIAHLEIRIRYLEQRDGQEPTYFTHSYSRLPRLILVCGRRAVTIGSSGVVGMITVFYKRFRLFSSFQRPRASVSTGREGPTAIVIGRSLVADLHLQTNLR